MVGIKEQGFATHCSSISTHLSIRCGGARVSREEKGKAGVFFLSVRKLDGPIRRALRSTVKKEGHACASTARRK